MLCIPMFVGHRRQSLLEERLSFRARVTVTIHFTMSMDTSGLTRSLGYSPDVRNCQSAYARYTWWAWDDLNIRPHAYQACALTN